MLPVKLAALNSGMTEADAVIRSWHFNGGLRAPVC